MDHLLSELKHILRRLLATPVFTAVTLLTLAIGIGANTAVFSVLDTVLLQPLPYSDPSRLVAVWHSAPGINIPDLNIAPSNYFVYRSENRSFTDIGIYNEDSVSVTGLAQPEQISALDVTDGTLPLLGVQPALGRLFNRHDDSPGAPKTTVISYAYWQSHFGASPSVLGRRIVLDGDAREIIGVMPRNFRFLDLDPSFYLPLQFDPAKTFLGNFSFEAVARLKPGATIEQASADIARMLPIVWRRFNAPPGFSARLFEDARIGPNLRPFKHELTGDLGKLLWVLMGALALVLLIACANVANLLLVRAEGRHQELAIRAALGAGRAALARHLILESLVLGLLGGALGLAFAFAALRLLISLAPSLPRLDQISLNPPVLLFALAASLLSALLFGLVPVFKFTGPNLAIALRGGSRTQAGSRERNSARAALVVLQVSLAVVLLISSGLMIRTFQALRNVDPGFTGPGELQAFRVDIPETQVKDPAAVLRMEQDIRDRLLAIPAVSSVAISDRVPMGGIGWHDLVIREDVPYVEGKIPPVRAFTTITPGFFSTIGARLAAGRDYTWADIAQRTPIAIVNETLARDFWGSPANALHKRIRESFTTPWREIVGVAADIHSDGYEKPVPATVYWPIAMDNFEGDKVRVQRGVAFILRSPRAGSSAFLAQVRSAVWSVNPNLPLHQVQTVADLCRKSLARTSFTLIMIALSGAMALLLGIVGVYGVISYSVSQRTREIGIRIALGAPAPGVASLFLRHGLSLAAVGLAFGLAASFAVTRLLTSLLYGVSPLDPLCFTLAPLLLASAAALSSYLPARRACAIDPIQALRAE